MATVSRETHTHQLQVAEIFTVTESVESTPSDDDETNNFDVCLFSMFIVFGAFSAAMTVYGILDIHLCPGHTILAVYMLVQGATSVFIPILQICQLCCQRISGKVIDAICAIIGLFNIGWGVKGTLWISDDTPCHDTPLHDHAVWFSVPLWLLFLSVIGSVCYRKRYVAVLVPTWSIW